MPGDALKGLQGADAAWAKLRSEEFCVPPPTPAVEERSGERLLTPGERPEYDVVVVGGTLGIFVAAALAVKGLKVAVVEQGVLAGRTQEWNISRKELAALVEAGVLSEAELDEIIVSDFSPQRGESKILARPELPPLPPRLEVSGEMALTCGGTASRIFGRRGRLPARYHPRGLIPSSPTAPYVLLASTEPNAPKGPP